MRHLILTVVLIALPAIGFASSDTTCTDLTEDTVLGTTETEVTDALKAMGYDIRKAEQEDDKIEVYFVKDAIMAEVYVSPETGKITKMSCEGE